ncbi:MAG TPA: hypothetical protein VD794_06525 [Flavisolibacter sp.]|nr:hypothetical protein [Flavisolibacter sp.]
MNIAFEIQSIHDFNSEGQHIVARQLVPGIPFTISPKSHLGGVELQEYLDMPRALDVTGQQRSDLFVFKPVNKVSDALVVSSVVQLVTPA